MANGNGTIKSIAIIITILGVFAGITKIWWLNPYRIDQCEAADKDIRVELNVVKEKVAEQNIAIARIEERQISQMTLLEKIEKKLPNAQ